MFKMKNEPIIYMKTGSNQTNCQAANLVFGARMLRIPARAPRRIILAAILLGTVPLSFAQSPEAMATAHRWVAAKFLGEVAPKPAESSLLVYTQSGPVTKNGIQGHQFRIVDREYSRGLHFSSDGVVRVVLAGPAKSFEATVGVDSNGLGYYSSAGRGAVVASLEVAGKTLFRSEVMHEGMAGVPVKVDLGNAAEFDLKVEDGGGGVVFGNHFDQAEWADARVTLADGKTVWLGDLPMGPLRAPFTTHVPFSFRYGGQPSSYLLKMWERHLRSRRLDDNRMEHTPSTPKRRSNRPGNRLRPTERLWIFRRGVGQTCRVGFSPPSRQAGQPGLFTPRDVNGLDRAIETRSVSEGKSLSRPRLRFGLRWVRG